MKVNKLLVVTSLLLSLLVLSCSKKDFGSSISDLIGTEWSYTDDEGTIGLKFYANNVVTSFLDNKFGIATISGTYEYIESSKTLAFKGLTWYYSETGTVAMTMTGAHIVDDKRMEVVLQIPDIGVEKDYLYRK